MRLFIKYVILSIVGVAAGHLTVFILGWPFDLNFYWVVPAILAFYMGLIELLNFLKVIDL